ncbi:MAG: DinB family protein [Bacteroidetes bacterium]|nr:DinB family protein [Bacteroidota bacterium]
MFRTTEDFIKDWKFESDSTLKVINSLTDESLDQKISPDGRTLGFLAWHLAITIPEMMGLTGLKINGPGEKSPCPEKVSEILDEFKKASDSLIDEIKKNWNDDILQTEDELYGEKWKKGLTLFYLMLHQTHHRGQMTVLMRQAGLKVPGIYGPSREEWISMGMEPLP